MALTTNTAEPGGEVLMTIEVRKVEAIKATTKDG
jgi:hypothetical protein